MYGASFQDNIRNILPPRKYANQITLPTKCCTFQFSRILSRTPFLQSSRDSPFFARICRLWEPCRYHCSSKLPRSHAYGKRKKYHPCYLAHWYVMILEPHVKHNLRLLGPKLAVRPTRRQTFPPNANRQLTVQPVWGTNEPPKKKDKRQTNKRTSHWKHKQTIERPSW